MADKTTRLGIGNGGVGGLGIHHCVHSCKFIAHRGDSKSTIPTCLALISFGSHSRYYVSADRYPPFSPSALSFLLIEKKVLQIDKPYSIQ